METHDVPCVETLDQCIKWFDDCVGRYGGERCIKELADKLDGLVMSTAFSGIGAADVAMETLLHGIQTYTHLPAAYRNAFAIEYKRVSLTASILGMQPTVRDELLGCSIASTWSAHQVCLGPQQ